MARIRTIKPEFFRHHELYKAEKETRLPLRIAFAGLWTVADKEGRFKWRPVEIKLDCLPFDELDFSRVLDALLTRGFLVRYGPNQEFGAIPGFKKHQVINNKERISEIPSPKQEDFDARPTRDERVGEKPLMEGKGRGMEGKGTITLAPPGAFESFWQAYPRKKSKGQAMKAWAKIPAEQIKDVLTGLERAKQSADWQRNKNTPQYLPYPASWLNALGWQDGLEVALPAKLEKRVEPKKHVHDFRGLDGQRSEVCLLCGQVGLEGAA